ncbi:MAG: hypothetical protein ABF756_10250 [Liquorilactobacillus ghanensis]|uniref:ATP-binding protein n=1 Tax=Liquorilactobacillus ghanensis TaxID=399370 RepID=UPI0039ECCCA3
MKLISCQIINFGKLHNFNWQFKPGLNTIFAENGWGKTTLTAFIVVMFYGFENEHKRNLVDNERKRYRPWQGGAYGGKLVFATAGKKYLLERTFGVRPKEDHFALYDAVTNLPSNDFSSKLGEELFGIERASFENTLFIAQQNCQTDVTPGINAKIGNLASEQADMNSYQLVQEKFKDYLNHLTPKRKTGELYQLRAKIAKIKVDLERQPAIMEQVKENKQQLAVFKQQYEQLQQEQLKLQETLRQSSQNQDQQLLQKKYQLLNEQKLKSEKKIKLIKQNFLGEVPTLTEIEQQQKIAEQIKIIKKTTAESFTIAAHERLEGFKQRRFSQLTAAKLTEMTAKNRQLQILKQQQQSKLSDIELTRLRAAQIKFSQHAVTESELEHLTGLISQRQSLLSQLEKQQLAWQTWQQATTGEYRRSRSNTPTKSPFWILGSVLSFVLGILLFKSSLIFSICLILLGILILGWKFSSSTSNTTEKSAPQLSELEMQIKDLKQQIEKITLQLKQKLQQLDFDWPLATAATELAKLKSEYLDFQQLQQRQDQTISAADLKQQQMLQTELANFLNYYQAPKKETTNSEYSILLQQLQYEFQEYQQLLQKALQVQSDQQRQQQLLQEQQRFFVELQQPISQSSATLQEIRDQVLALQQQQQQLDNIKVEIADFISKNKLTQPKGDQAVAEETSSLSKLTEKLTLLKQQADQKRTQCWQINDHLDKLQQQVVWFEELAEQRDELQQKESQLFTRYQTLMATSKYLAAAKNNFSARYMNPIMQNFKHYYQQLTQESAQQYRLDAELNLTAGAYGKQHQLELLSEGYQDLLGICRRLSLIDAMYQQEKPLIIFDDPFVNLDAEKLHGGLNLLQELVKDHQVIYLTCHTSRTIEKNITSLKLPTE